MAKEVDWKAIGENNWKIFIFLPSFQGGTLICFIKIGDKQSF